VTRGDLRLLLSGPTSSAGRPMPDGRKPAPGGWNRIHFVVEDLAAEVERLRAAGVQFRNETITGPGGSQIVLDDPSGNPITLEIRGESRKRRATPGDFLRPAGRRIDDAESQRSRRSSISRAGRIVQGWVA
jgi:hypothetical protein